MYTLEPMAITMPVMLMTMRRNITPMKTRILPPSRAWLPSDLHWAVEFVPSLVKRTKQMIPVITKHQCKRKLSSSIYHVIWWFYLIRYETTVKPICLKVTWRWEARWMLVRNIIGRPKIITFMFFCGRAVIVSKLRMEFVLCPSHAHWAPFSSISRKKVNIIIKPEFEVYASTIFKSSSRSMIMWKNLLLVQLTPPLIPNALLPPPLLQPWVYLELYIWISHKSNHGTANKDKK